MQAWQPKAERATTRIARLIARAHSSLTSSHFTNLQQQLFEGAFASSDELLKVTDLVPTGTSTPEASLLHLMRIFIDKGRVETVWRILRYYGYSTTLELEQDFLESAIPLEIRNDGSELIEFSDAGWNFFQGLWHTFSRVRRLNSCKRIQS